MYVYTFIYIYVCIYIYIDKQALDSETASCTTPHVRCSPVSSRNPPR